MERVIRSRSPVGLEGTSIVVLEPERVVLGGVPVCDLQDAAPLLPGVRDSVRLLGRDHELVPGTSLDHLVADLDPEALVEHDPELVPELVVVLARLVPGLDRDHADRGRLVEGVRLDLPPGLIDDHSRSGFGRRSRTSAVSMAAIAASHPLLPCLPPARSRACSKVSVVSTPKTTGTPVSMAASRIPRAAWPATWSKWAVSPRITAPRQITASYPPDAARRFATRGSSKAPGTHTRSRSPSA